jgi:SAM-dependent methyltransferase
MLSKAIRYFKRTARAVFSNNRVNENTVQWAYRIFLDREPDNRQQAQQIAARHMNTAELRAYFINSQEFRNKNSGLYAPALSGMEPAQHIEYAPPASDLQQLFQHVQNTWQKLGEDRPYWSVITADVFLPENINANRDAFYDSGKADIERILNTLARNQIDSSKLKSCLEYGCGLGRVTLWLSERFTTVYGCDISRTHLELARENLDAHGAENVKIVHIRAFDDIQTLPKVDFIYSVIVLQHNPPPIIHLIIENFMKALNPGGIALFQAPTYRTGYQFSMKQYLEESLNNQEMEMHVLPQKAVFEIVHQQGGRVIEVIEDGWAGFRPGEMSNTFLIQKNT